MILYGEPYWYSPYFFTAFVALTEKGLPFEVRELDLEGGEARTPEHRARSLTARIPALEHDGFGLSESLAMVEYLEDTHPPPKWPSLLPADVRARARARQIMNFLRSDLLALREERSTETMFYAHATAPLGPAASAAVEKLLYVTTALVGDGRGPLFGEWCIADSDLAFMLQRLVSNGDAIPEPALRYARTQWERPSVRSYVEHDRPPLFAP